MVYRTLYRKKIAQTKEKKRPATGQNITYYLVPTYLPLFGFTETTCSFKPIPFLALVVTVYSC